MAFLSNCGEDEPVASDIDKERLLLETAKKRAVAERIRKLRIGTGLNQEDFAAQANLHRAHYGFVESERREPKLGTLIRIANGLNISLSELVAVSAERVEQLRQELSKE